MTLYVSFVFHIYQPPTQKPKILKQIIKESYRPLLQLLQNNPQAQLTLNINGSLTELLMLYEEETILALLTDLVSKEQIDLIGSSCYHAILPLIPGEEILRQIELNEDMHRKVLGEKFQPKGFWLPEMAYDYRVIESLTARNYEWTILSSIASPEEELPDDFIPYINSGFKVFFRNDLLSNLISFNPPTIDEFYLEMKGNKNPEKEDYYLILAMDGETFGHHIKGLIEDFLDPLVKRINNDPHIKLTRVIDLPEIFTEKKRILPKASSWSTTEEDLDNGVPFPLWSDPNNRIHQLQLAIMNHTLHLVSMAQTCLSLSEKDVDKIKERYTNARTWLDQGLHSCQLWWASARPWYSAEMILKGLNQLILASSEALKVVLWNSQDSNLKNHARKVFDEIFEAQKEILLTV
ncbi:MAG: hypothetical protein ACTSO7_00300 [Candidatus Heimdallarchaeota archaeon]